MSVFTGKQGKGAMRQRRLEKQRQAAERDAYGQAQIRAESKKSRRGTRGSGKKES